MIIYKAENLINHKIYIGQTHKTLNERISKHICETNSCKRKRTYFHNALNKYGIDNFKINVIDKAENEDELNYKEQYWISFYNSNCKLYGYNLDSGGKNCTKSESTKELISICKKEHWKDEKLRYRMKDGLNKATIKWIEISMNNKIKFICPVCGRSIMLAKWEFKKRKYCSQECANKINIEMATNKASEANHLKAIKLHENIKNDVLMWVIDNKNLVYQCPRNKVSISYQPMVNYIMLKYNIKDIRTIISAVMDSTNKKEFAQYIDHYIESYH